MSGGADEGNTTMLGAGDFGDAERREDRRLLTGAATYTDDVSGDRLHVGIVRSQYGHAVVEDVDTAADLRDHR